MSEFDVDFNFDFTGPVLGKPGHMHQSSTVHDLSSGIIASSPTTQLAYQLGELREAPNKQISVPKIRAPVASEQTKSRRPSTQRNCSSYWKVPDKSQFLTSVAVQNSLCAVGSGSHEDNLFIYELSQGNLMTHHQTISLPEIYSLDWVPIHTKIGSQGNVLVSGHGGGYVHMTLLPDTNGMDSSAAILKRYNHTRHLPKSQLNVYSAARVKHVKVVPQSWSCCSENSIASLCAEHLFLWEPTRGDTPVINQRIRGALCFDICENSDGVLAVGAKRGISIRDIRVRGGGSGLSPPDDNNEPVTHVKWSPHNEYQVAAVHSGSMVKIWDIRASKPLANYRGHTDNICGVEWYPDSQSELVSASADGTIRIWDLNYPNEDTTPTNKSSQVKAEPITAPESTKPGLSSSSRRQSAWSLYQKRCSFDDELDELALELLQARPHVQQRREFHSLALVGPNAAVSVDADGYLGYHNLRGAGEAEDDEDLEYERFNSMISFSPTTPAHSDASSDNDFLPPL